MGTWGVEKGYSNPVEFMEIDDLSRFTPTIKIILDLFNNYNAAQEAWDILKDFL